MAQEYTFKKVTFHKIEFMTEETSAIFESLDIADFFSWIDDQDESRLLKPYKAKRTTSIDYIEAIPNSIPGFNIESVTATYISKWFGYFSTSSGGINRDLRNSRTGKKRANTKDLDESDEIRNHFTLVETQKGVFQLIFQENGNGIEGVFFYQYLESKLKSYIIDRGGDEELPFKVRQLTQTATPDQIIARMDRVTRSEIVLTSDVLNRDLGLIEATEETRDTVSLEIKAEIRKSIKSMVQGIIGLENERIERVYVEGKSNSGGKLGFWIDQVKKKITIKIHRDPITKTMITDSIRLELIKLVE